MDARRTIDQRHRVTIPRQTFVQSGLHTGDRVTVRSGGPGRIVIECHEVSDGLGESYGDGYVGWITGGDP